MESTSPEITKRLAVNRFISTLAGTFRSFHLYQAENKVFEEMMLNLVKRFHDAIPAPESLKLAVTNRSLLYEGEPAGYPDIVVLLSGTVRSLGFKEIIFQAPLQGRHFFQILHILSSKEPDEAKLERLVPFLWDGETKPVSLVPRTASSSLVRLSDERIIERLAPLLIPKAQGGSGFVEELAQTRIANFPDLYTWICVKAGMLSPPLATLTRTLADATREGYFSTERFLKVFPLPTALKKDFETKLVSRKPRPRRASLLGHAYAGKKAEKSLNSDWISRLVVFNEEETKNRAALRSIGAQQSSLQDLELAGMLLKDSGANFLMGMSFLLRYMNDKNPLPVQEKAIQLGIEVWLNSQSGGDDHNALSMRSSLRQSLTSFSNISLVLFPIRNLTVESSMYSDIVKYFHSLGKPALPALISALDAEQDRGMRKKLCQLIGQVAKDNGPETLVQAMNAASPFLLRNLLLILGDIRFAPAIPEIIPLLRHPQKIVCIEAIRSLCKFGNEQANQALVDVLERLPDEDSRLIVLEYIRTKKPNGALATLIRVAKIEKQSLNLKKAAANTIAAYGNDQARQFLQSLTQESSFVNRLSSDHRDLAAHIRGLLERMNP